MFANIIFCLFILMGIRIIWNMRKEKERMAIGSGRREEYESPLTMSIQERMRRKHRHFKWLNY